MEEAMRKPQDLSLTVKERGTIRLGERRNNGGKRRFAYKKGTKNRGGANVRRHQEEERCKRGEAWVGDSAGRLRGRSTTGPNMGGGSGKRG